MKKALFLSMTVILAIGLSVGMLGCGEDENGEEEEKKPAEMLSTTPISGGEMPVNGSLVITFNGTVTEVKVNGASASVAGATATWKGQELQTGSQTFRIEWTDAEGNTGSEEITLNITAIDDTPPSVSEISIEDGAVEVDPGEVNDAGITIKFSEPINTGKIELVLLDGGGNELAWTPTWSDNNTQVVLKTGPTTKLRSGVEYTLTVSSYFDGADNEGSPATVNFSTSGVSLPTEDLQLWLKADEGVTLDGNSVSLWEDQSGNGADAEQGNEGNQPFLDISAANGLPALDFDGVDDFMTFTLPINDLTGITIFLVSAAAQDIDVPFPHCQYAAIFWNETASWGTAHLTPLQGRVWMRFGTGQTQPLPVVYEHTASVGDSFTISAAMMDGVTDYLYINGELVFTNEKPAGQTTIANQQDLGNIGRGYNDDTYFPGMIAEILIYTKTLSEDELQQVEEYLSEKYSIR